MGGLFGQVGKRHRVEAIALPLAQLAAEIEQSAGQGRRFRDARLGTAVAFEVRPWHRGRYEATAITRRPGS